MSKARGLADLGNVYDDGALSNRNLFINGAMQVWQRGTSGFSHNVYSADRWEEQTNTNDVLSVSRVEALSSGETGLPRQFTYMANFALTAGTTGNLNDLRQKVENPKGLAGQTLTLSYYIKASSSCTINNRRIGWNGVTNAPPATYLPSLNVTTGWQRVENTFTLESSGTAVYASNANLDVVLGLPVNTTVDVYITGVQLELGDTATPFEHRSYGQELALCQRFYTKSYPADVIPGIAANATAGGFNIGTDISDTGRIPTDGLRFPVEMRANPTLTLYPGRTTVTATSGYISKYNGNNITAVSNVHAGTRGFRGYIQAANFYDQYSMNYTADAEL